MADLFLSYARDDRECAKLLAKALAARGWTVWWDRQIEVGQSFSETIERELEAARLVIVLWSQHSLDSPWVRNEAADAALRKALLPVRVEDVRPPLEFRRLQTADLSDWRSGIDKSLEFQSLLVYVESLLGQRLAPQSSDSEEAHTSARTQQAATIARSTFRNGAQHSPLSHAELVKTSPSESSPGRDQVFISYSHRDERWLRRLQVHLRPLERHRLIRRWDDTLLQAGNDWRREIRDAIAHAKVAILLVSADFIASDFVFTDELPPLLSAAQSEGAVVLPIIVSPCRFEQMHELSRFQAFNPPSKPLAAMTRIRQEQIFADVVARVEAILLTTRAG